jgi:hypothetical protein
MKCRRTDTLWRSPNAQVAAASHRDPTQGAHDSFGFFLFNFYFFNKINIFQPLTIADTFELSKKRIFSQGYRTGG